MNYVTADSCSPPSLQTLQSCNGGTMSNLSPTANRKAVAQADEKRDAWTFALVCVVLCLINVVLVLANDTFARAVELTGQY